MATKDKSAHYWYARNTSIFMTKTGHLSMSAMGAYDRLLDWYYQNRKPLPKEWVQMHRVCKAVAPEEQAIVQEVVQEFFTLQDDGWHNEKADEEIAKAEGISEKRRKAQAEKERLRLEKEQKAPKKRGANKGANAPANADTTNNYKKEDTIVSSPPIPQGGTLPDSFLMPDGAMLSLDGMLDRFWQLYPKIRDRGHKGQAKEELVKKLKAGVNYETIGRGVAKYSRYCEATGERNKDFSRWLKDSQWERDYTIPAETQAGHGRGSKDTLSTALDLALADKTHQSGGSDFDFSLRDDTSDVSGSGSLDNAAAGALSKD